MDFVHIYSPPDSNETLCGLVAPPVPTGRAGQSVSLCEECRLLAWRSSGRDRGGAGTGAEPGGGCGGDSSP